MNDSRKRNISQIQNEYKEQMERKQQYLKRKRRGLYRRLTVFGAVALLAAIVFVEARFGHRLRISMRKKRKKRSF